MWANLSAWKRHDRCVGAEKNPDKKKTDGVTEDDNALAIVLDSDCFDNEVWPVFFRVCKTSMARERCSSTDLDIPDAMLHRYPWSILRLFQYCIRSWKHLWLQWWIARCVEIQTSGAQRNHPSAFFSPLPAIECLKFYLFVAHQRDDLDENDATEPGGDHLLKYAEHAAYAMFDARRVGCRSPSDWAAFHHQLIQLHHEYTSFDVKQLTEADAYLFRVCLSAYLDCIASDVSSQEWVERIQVRVSCPDMRQRFQRESGGLSIHVLDPSTWETKTTTLSSSSLAPSSSSSSPSSIRSPSVDESKPKSVDQHAAWKYLFWPKRTEKASQNRKRKGREEEDSVSAPEKKLRNGSLEEEEEDEKGEEKKKKEAENETVSPCPPGSISPSKWHPHVVWMGGSLLNCIEGREGPPTKAMHFWILHDDARTLRSLVRSFQMEIIRLGDASSYLVYDTYSKHESSVTLVSPLLRKRYVFFRTRHVCVWDLVLALAPFDAYKVWCTDPEAYRCFADAERAWESKCIMTGRDELYSWHLDDAYARGLRVCPHFVTDPNRKVKRGPDSYPRQAPSFFPSELVQSTQLSIRGIRHYLSGAWDRSPYRSEELAVLETWQDLPDSPPSSSPLMHDMDPSLLLRVKRAVAVDEKASTEVEGSVESYMVEIDRASERLIRQLVVSRSRGGSYLYQVRSKFPIEKGPLTVAWKDDWAERHGAPVMRFQALCACEPHPVIRHTKSICPEGGHDSLETFSECVES
jgi:hypothetical protein